MKKENSKIEIKIGNKIFILDKEGLKVKKTTLKSNLSPKVETSTGYHFVSQMEQTKK